MTVLNETKSTILSSGLYVIFYLWMWFVGYKIASLVQVMNDSPKATLK